MDTTTRLDMLRHVVAVSLDWLYDTEQPDGAILNHHGITPWRSEPANRYLEVCPRVKDDLPVLVLEVLHRDHHGPASRPRNTLERGELEQLATIVQELGEPVLDIWNGHPATTGSVQLARPAHPTLVAAVERYHRGCPDHTGGVFCGCGWYAVGNRLIRKP